MAKFISELRSRLQSEHQFISSQKQLLEILAKNVEAKLSDLYLAAWFLTYLKEHYEKVKSRSTPPIDFVKLIQYKCSLLGAEGKLSQEIVCHENPNLILSTLRQEPQIVALLFLQQERSYRLDTLARVVYSSVYGGLLTAYDEFMYLKVMMELLCRELAECKSSYELLQKGSGFKSLFTLYVENSLDVKGYFLTVLQKQIHFLMDEELFLEFEERKAEMHANPEFAVETSSEEIKVKIKESAEFIGSLITALIRSLNQQLALTPYAVRILANLLKREISKKWTLPVEAIQSCLANLIFGSFVVPVIADPASFGLVEDSLLTERIRSNLNCMATVLQNMSRMHWRLLSSDLKLVFKSTNLNLYASYIDSLVLDQEWQREFIDGNMSFEKFKNTAGFFYRKIESERTHFIVSKGDMIFLQNIIANINKINSTNESGGILGRLKESKALVLTPEKHEIILSTRKKKQSTDSNTSIHTTNVLPKLMLFPVKDREWDQPQGIEIKSEEEIMFGRKQPNSFRDIARENTAIQSALKESYYEGSTFLTRSAKTRQNSVSGYDTLRRQIDSVCHLSSVDDSSESCSSTGDEEDKSYEGDTSGIGSLANSNSSSYKTGAKVAAQGRPPLPPYPSTKASNSQALLSPVEIGQQQSNSDSLEHSDSSEEPATPSKETVRVQRSASLGNNEWEKEDSNLYENAAYLRTAPAQKKSNTLVPSPKKPVAISDSLPAPKVHDVSEKSKSSKVSLRKGNKISKNARHIFKTVSTFGHPKQNKRLDSYHLSKSNSQSDMRETNTPVKDSEWSRLRSTTFTYMTMRSQKKDIPTSKYFTLLPLDASVRSSSRDMGSILKRVRLVLSNSSYPALNIPEPELLPVEIQQQVTQLGAANSLDESQQQISMSNDVANKRSLISMLNHEFNLAISRNDTPQIALTSDLLHIIDLMPEGQVGVVLDGLKKEYAAREEYIRYLTQTSLKLSSQQEQVLTFEKSLLSQVEELEKLFMDTEVRSFLLQNNFLSQLDANLSQTDHKPLTIHKFVYLILEQMDLDPMWHNWVHHDELLCSIERNIYNHVYYGLFFPNGIKDQDDNELFKIRLEMLGKKLRVDDSYLGIASKYHFSSPWPGALQLLHTINLYKAPRDKLSVITRCCKLITNLLHFTDPTGALGADEILPVLIYVTVNANPKYVCANSAFLEQYSDSIEKGESAYWFNQFFIAITNITTMFNKHGIV